MLVRNLKIRIVSSFAPREGEGYYGGVERRYRAAGIVIAVALVIFVLASLIFGFREFTYQNIYYFFKDFDTVISADRYPVDAIDYGSGEGRSYVAFKGGIAVADRYSVSVYSSGGRRTAGFNVGYYSPQLRASEKYLLIYESGGNAFSVCNSFIRLYSETLPGEIYAAEINAAGEVLVHTSDSRYRAVLYLYDSGFSRAAAYYIGDYVTATAISADGKYILAATVDAASGSYVSTLRVYRRGETEPRTILTTDGEMIMKCGAFADGFYALTDRGVYVVDANGKVRSHTALADGRGFVSCEAGEKCLAALSHDGDGYQLVYVPSQGEGMSVRLDAAPLSLGVSGRQAYVLFDGAVARYDFESGSVGFAECTPGELGMVVTAARRVLVCYATRAVYSEFAEVTK